MTFTDSPADYVTLNYMSNLDSCSLRSTPNIPDTVLPYPQGEVSIAPPASGTYELFVLCGGLLTGSTTT